MRRTRIRTLLAGLLAALLLGVAVQATERSEIPVKYTWNLADLYPSPQAWEKAKDDIAKRIPGLSAYEGHLGDSPAKLSEALSLYMQLSMELERLGSYAVMRADEDRRVSENLAAQQVVEQLGVQFGTATAFAVPEILAMGSEKVRQFVASEPKLREYAFFLEDILRHEPHTLTAAEEKIVAQAGSLTDAGEAIHSIFTNAELPYPTVTLGDREQVRLDAAAYTLHRASPNRADRDRVFQQFWGEYNQFKGTLGVSLYNQVKGHIFNRDVHKYSSCLQASLFNNNIPTDVYEQLIRDVHANLPTLHRYLKLRQRMMGVDQLRYEDLYAPILERVDLKYTPEEAMALTLAAVKPLGSEYVAALQKGFDSRWVDFLPSTGKRSGAYSQGVYGVHPYQLQNFMGRYEDVSTVAHEAGHSMHTYLANKTQPYVDAHYTIFTAEVASTLNENLLLHQMLGATRDDAVRLYLLGNALDNMRQTLFRQTLFAEFELRIHELAEKGESLTGDNMSALYGKLVREYYGHDQDVCKVDSLYSVEWAYIPHFYYNFYVYQYATSMIASVSIANRIRDEVAAKKPSTAARDAYLAMLSAGGSKYPIDLLKMAGVDMTTSVPFQAAMREMNGIMDEMEAILARRGGK
jgi:oligoendopeptidase F